MQADKWLSPTQQHLDGFRPLVRPDGYLPIADHGLLGDGSTSALIGRDGAVSWMCLPRFDSPPLFCGLLDRERGGFFRIDPEGLETARQYYVPDSGVLVTELRTATGVVRITDALTLNEEADLTTADVPGRSELLRIIEVPVGRVRLTIRVAPRGETTAEPIEGGIRLHPQSHPDLDLRMNATFSLQGLVTPLEVKAGDQHFIALRWGNFRWQYPFSPHPLLDYTINAWRRWSADLRYEGPQQAMVRRAVITLKMLDHAESGAIVAAPTSSLPEAIGGIRNWDYRYTWIRDAAFSVHALRRVGYPYEAAQFLDWVMKAIERTGTPKVLYTLDGAIPDPERLDPELSGYRNSAPVRWGNAADAQTQHDAYGEIIDCAWQWAKAYGLEEAHWYKLVGFIETARARWCLPDHGIWEVRTPGEVFTYSAAMCHVALDRGVKIATKAGLPGPLAIWRQSADRIQRVILQKAWSPQINALAGTFGGNGLDASVLSLPMRRVIPATHPKMVATVAAISQRLAAGGGLLYRYLHEEVRDGLPGHEGAFLLCSFWLVDNLTLQGRLEEAMDLYDSLCARSNNLGLLPEEIDPVTGEFLGNYPQAFSHIGVVLSGVMLARALARGEEAGA